VPGSRFALGVQWHPEADETSRLIQTLVAEAAAVKTARA
jgi:gamma-glutamyl-gamma-aminobutyrate hydrolase PuuD